MQQRQGTSQILQKHWRNNMEQIANFINQYPTWMYIILTIATIGEIWLRMEIKEAPTGIETDEDGFKTYQDLYTELKESNRQLKEAVIDEAKLSLALTDNYGDLQIKLFELNKKLILANETIEFQAKENAGLREKTISNNLIKDHVQLEVKEIKYPELKEKVVS